MNTQRRSSWSALIPEYLAALPVGLPQLEIETGADTRRWYGGNEWVLQAPVSSGFLNWDVWLFFPNQDYPSSGYGGSIERIADWAYVHE